VDHCCDVLGRSLRSDEIRSSDTSGHLPRRCSRRGAEASRLCRPCANRASMLATRGAARSSAGSLAATFQVVEDAGTVDPGQLAYGCDGCGDIALDGADHVDECGEIAADDFTLAA